MVAGGADAIRIAKCEKVEDVHTVVRHIEMAEREFGAETGKTLLMAAWNLRLGYSMPMRFVPLVRRE